MNNDYRASIETRARRLASNVDHEQLRKHAELLQKEKKPAARVFWRAIEMQKEDRALETSLALTERMGNKVYGLRPNGALPGDGIGRSLQ